MKKYFKRAATNKKIQMCFKEDIEDTYISSQEYINTIQIIHYIDSILTHILMEIENNNAQIAEDETIEIKSNNVQRQKD